MAINTITDWFDKDDFKLHKSIKQMLLEACEGVTSEALFHMEIFCKSFTETYPIKIMSADLKLFSFRTLVRLT